MAERRFVVEGPQAVREALAAGALLELFFEPGRQLDLVTEAYQAGVLITEVTAEVLAAMGETVTPQGVLGTASLLDVPLSQALSGSPRLVIVLDGVSDPGNAGTAIRVADAAGADAVILSGGSVDPHGGKCVRSTAGSLWHLPIVYGPDLVEIIPALRAAGLQILATTGSGAEDLDDLIDNGDLRAPTGWLLGPEAAGLSASALEAADRRVRIPLHGRAESLNLGTAAAVVAYASARAQRH